MAIGVEVFLSGLMLICLDGQTNCPVGTYAPNTAWVVKADGKSEPCGWKSTTETILELSFKTGDFYPPLGKWVSDNICKVGNNETVCSPLSDGDLCIYTSPATQEQRQEASLRWLPRLDEVDRRFKALRPERIKDSGYVPARIHFPTGVVGAGPKWPDVATPNPRRWFRSDMSASGALPRELSDRVRVVYDSARKIEVKSCGDASLLISLMPKVNRAKLVFQNRADKLDDYEGDYFNDLTYLLWYYRLGAWDTRYGFCPEFSVDKKDAVLLRCYQNDVGYPYCSAYGTAASTRFWPPMLGPGFSQ